MSVSRTVTPPGSRPLLPVEGCRSASCGVRRVRPLHAHTDGRGYPQATAGFSGESGSIRRQLKEGLGIACVERRRSRGSSWRERTSGEKPRSRPSSLVLSSPSPSRPSSATPSSGSAMAACSDATICANSAGRAVREHFGDGQQLRHDHRLLRGLVSPRTCGLRARREPAVERRHLHHRGRQRRSHGEPRRVARYPRRVPGRVHRPRSSRARGRALQRSARRHLHLRPSGLRPDPRDRLPGYQGDADP